MLSSTSNFAANNKAVIALGYASAVSALGSLAYGITAYRVLQDKKKEQGFVGQCKAKVGKFASTVYTATAIITAITSATFAYAAISRGIHT